MVCVMQVLRDVAMIFGPHGIRVSAVLEGEPGLGQAIEYFNYLKKKRLDWAQAFSTVGTGDKSILGIQAADLLAYESRRHLEAVLNNGGDLTALTHRKPFRRLIRNDRVNVNLLNEEHILPVIPDLKALVAQGLLI
jgi:hypothetical protein